MQWTLFIIAVFSAKSHILTVYKKIIVGSTIVYTELSISISTLWTVILNMLLTFFCSQNHIVIVSLNFTSLTDLLVISIENSFNYHFKTNDQTIALKMLLKCKSIKRTFIQLLSCLKHPFLSIRQFRSILFTIFTLSTLSFVY